MIGINGTIGIKTKAMHNFKLIYKIIGSLLFLEVALMAVCLGVALYFGEDDIFTFLSSMIVTVMAGIAFRYLGRNANNNLSRRDSYLVVSLVWVVFSVFGTLPFLWGGYLRNFTDAFFETMAGFTTTGATIIDDVERLPHGILFWRSLTQWIGGLGIVFLTTALLPSLAGGSTKVFAAEATGPMRTRLHPKLSTGARWIWLVYLTITIGCMASYMLFGMNWFEGVNYAMATSATGGFSIHNSSIEHFHSPAMDYTTIVFCFLSGVSFSLLYFSAAKFRWKELWHNVEMRTYCCIVLAFTAIIMTILLINNHYDVEHAFRAALFQVVSFITTTGLYNDDVALWPQATWLLLALVMTIGACSGSTTGGIKTVRAIMLFKVIKNEIGRRLHPNAVLPLKVNGQNISYNERLSLLAFLTAYGLLIGLFVFFMMCAGVDITNSISISVSIMSNTGPSLGVGIGPEMSWSSLPDAAKWFCSMMMLVGRLEIFTILVILSPSFWNKV